MENTIKIIKQKIITRKQPDDPSVSYEDLKTSLLISTINTTIYS